MKGLDCIFILCVGGFIIYNNFIYWFANRCNTSTLTILNIKICTYIIYLAVRRKSAEIMRMMMMMRIMMMITMKMLMMIMMATIR